MFIVHYVQLKDFLNKNVLSFFLNNSMLSAFLISNGKGFQSAGAEDEKARSPRVVFPLNLGVLKSIPLLFRLRL